MDFGAGQTVYDDPEMLKSIQNAFSDKNFIFLLLPYEDKEKTKKLLQKRMEQRDYHAHKNKNLPLISRLTKRLKVDPNQVEINNGFIESPSNITLASHIIYTNNATPREIAEAINSIYNGKPIPKGKVKIVKNPYRIRITNSIQPIPHHSLKSQSQLTYHISKVTPSSEKEPYYLE